MLYDTILRYKFFLKDSFPLLSIFIAVILDRFHVFRALPLEPNLTFPIIYYWTIHRAECLPVTGIFLAGILDDALGGAYLGQNTLEFLFLFGSVLGQRQYLINSSFFMGWLILFFLSLGLMVLEWGIASLVSQKWLDATPLFLQNTLSVILYPWLTYLFNKIKD
jgi:rod shape-determining protein MreD